MRMPITCIGMVRRLLWPSGTKRVASLLATRNRDFPMIPYDYEMELKLRVIRKILGLSDETAIELWREALSLVSNPDSIRGVSDDPRVDKEIDMREDVCKWVDALESGDYLQTRGTLHNLKDGGYCCLGVYSKVNGIATDKLMGRWPFDDGDIDEGPEEIYQTIRDRLGEAVVSDSISMNDEREASFPEIAAMIREKYEDYFND